jgi:hypothetical protein
VIERIHLQGVMAQAKRFGAYTQENGRARLNQALSPRALSEVLNAPFSPRWKELTSLRSCVRWVQRTESIPARVRGSTPLSPSGALLASLAPITRP